MERLTKRSNKTVHENGVCCTHYLSEECEERSGFCTDECPWEEAAWSRLADYEDAEEQGLLLRLPCPIGTEVWTIMCGMTGNHPILFKQEFGYFMIEHFGKAVFLTREEAEAALAEKGGAE